MRVFLLQLFLWIIFLSNTINSYSQHVTKDILSGGNPGVRKFIIRPGVNKALAVGTDVGSHLASLLNLRQEDRLTGERKHVDARHGFVQQRFHQVHRGVRVEYSSISVNSQKGVIISVSGELYDILDNLVAVPSLKEAEALHGALGYVGASKYMWEDDAEEAFLKNALGTSATYVPKGELVYVQVSRPGGGKAVGDMTLAYQFDIYAAEPMSRRNIYVDAHTGYVVHDNPIIKDADGTAATRYSGSKMIATTFYGTPDNVYRLRDQVRGIETFNLNKSTTYASAADFTDLDNNWSSEEFNNADKDNAALDAHWGAMKTYDYFKDVHQHNSYDGNGAKIYNFVHYGTGYANAFWNGIGMTYGDGDNAMQPLTALDICAHEIAHAVCTSTANLVYQNESGALNESLSDIWAATIEHYAAPDKDAWSIGEDIGVAFRSMSNPSSRQQPDTYQGNFWYTGPEDNGGVHRNSGVMNYWYYLLVMGGTGINDLGQNYSVSGIGFDKAADIVYLMETAYLTPNSNHSQARSAALQATTDLFGTASNEFTQVGKAWDAVGIFGAFAPPGNLSFIDYPSPTSVKIRWADNSNEETGFVVERSVNNTSNFLAIATLPAESVEYIDENLSNGEEGYWYRVKALKGSQSTVYSNPVNVTMYPLRMENRTLNICNSYFTDKGTSANGTGPYANGQNLVMTVFPGNAGTNVKVSFSMFSTDGSIIHYWDGVKVEYPLRDYLIIHDGDDINDPVLALYTGHWDDAPDVNATNPAGALTFHFVSNSEKIELGWMAHLTCDEKIQAPTNLSIPSNTNDRVDLRWTDNSTNEDFFVVERKMMPDTLFRTIATLPPNTTEFSDTSLPYDVQLFYRVKAVRGTSFSAYTNTLEKVTGQIPLIMEEGSVTVCDVPFLDDSGHGNYAYTLEDVDSKTMVLVPQMPGSRVRITFEMFDVRASSLINDYLLVFDGATPDYSNLDLYRLTGTDLPPRITATNPEGKLTFQFAKRVGTINPPDISSLIIPVPGSHKGWKARLMCVFPAAAPTALAIQQVNSIPRLTWQDQATDEDGYIIERSSGGRYQVVASLPANTVTYNDLTVNNNREYSYRVRSTRDDVLSDPSNVVSLTLGTVPVRMRNGTITTCSSEFLDSGGDENYANNEDYTLTIQPSEANRKVKLNFSQFNLEQDFDNLTVYDGNSAAAPILVTLTGNLMPGEVVASNNSGVLTVRFRSDEYVRAPGWKAAIGCVSTDNNKVQPVIDFNDIVKTYGDDPFDLQATSYNDAIIIYSIFADPANTGQVRFSGSHNEHVTIEQAGIVKLKASIAETDDYFAAEKIITLTIQKGLTTMVFADLVKTYGDAPFDLSVTSNTGGVVQYSIVPDADNTGEVSLSGSRQEHVTLEQAGVVMLKATIAESVNYQSIEKTATLTIQKGLTTMTFAGLVKTYGDAPFDLLATSNTGGVVQYSIVPDAGNTGEVSLSGSRQEHVTLEQAGVVKLKATIAESVNYQGIEKTATLTIQKGLITMTFAGLVKTYGDAPFDLLATSNTGGVVQYSIVSHPDNTGEVSLSGSRQEHVTLEQAGVVMLKATIAESVNYQSIEKTATLTIQKGLTTMVFADLVKMYGDAPFDLSVTSNTGGVVQYSIVSHPDNTGEVSLSGSRQEHVTLARAGVVRLKATIDESDNYLSKMAMATLVINAASQTIDFTPIADQELGNETLVLEATASSGLPVQFEVVSGPAIVTSNIMVLTGSGTIAVQALQPGNENYLAATPVTRQFVIMNSHDVESGINLWPVPTSDIVTLASKAVITGIRVVDMFGREVLYFEPGKVLTELSLKQLAPGTYWLQINTDTGLREGRRVVLVK